MGQTLATYPSSSDPTKTYKIIKGADGITYCDCTAWKMRKTCKHLVDFMSNNGGKVSQISPISIIKSSVIVEKFKLDVGTTKIDHKTFISDKFQAQAFYQGCGSEIESSKPSEILEKLKEYETSGEWVSEPKMDGINITIFSDGKKNRFWSRNQLEKEYGLADMPLPAGTVLTGELGYGSEFALQRRAKYGYDFADIFGLLIVNYKPILHLDEIERRERLEEFMSKLSPTMQERFKLVPRWTKDFVSHYNDEHEGLVLKRKDGGLYIGMGTKPAHWMKAKKWFEIDMVVMDIRYSDAETKKGKGMVKDLLLGQYCNGQLKGLTWVGSMTDAWSKEFAQNFEKYQGKVMAVKANCQFKSGALRHASMIRMRDDKEASECIFVNKDE